MNLYEEETFDSLIEYDPVGSVIESQKENIQQEDTNTGAVKKKTRRSRTTATQLNMLASFMEGRRGFEKGSMRKTPENEKLRKEWSDLVDRLNQNGPPVRSKTDWRKTWSDFKRRKFFSVSPTHSMSPSQSSSTAAEISGSHRNISGKLLRFATKKMDFIDELHRIKYWMLEHCVWKRG